VRFRFIEVEKAAYGVRRLCRVLQVAPSGYYAWRGRPASARTIEDGRLLRLLQVEHAASRQTYGRLRLQRALRTHGVPVGEKRIRRLMQAGHLHARRRRPFRVTTDSTHAGPVVRNHLARRFSVAAPNRVWAADITALPTREGWAYLAVVLDLYARRVVGWAVDDSLETRLVLTAVTRALATRRVAPGLIHHSDRGSQYASAAYQTTLATHQIQPSMSRLADCWDNAPVESFFAGLKRKAMPEAAGRAGPSPSAPSRTTSISTTGAGCTPPTTTAVRWTPKPRLASRYDSTQPVHRIDPGSLRDKRSSHLSHPSYLSYLSAIFY
jgi:putative transposase